MGGRVLKFAASKHREVDALLPWLVNGTLEGAELAMVEEHLRECSRCRREAAWLRGLQGACAGSEVAPDAEESFRKLAARLDPPEPRVRPRSGPWARWGRGARELTGRLLPWTPWLAGAELLVILALGSLVWTGEGPSAPYRTLGSSEAPGSASGNLVVVFDPTAPESELRRLLHAVGARVVDGPTEADAYVLALPPADLAAARRTLAAEPGVVLVRPLGADGAVE